MIKSYIRIAIRNLQKYKAISFINLFGLTVGLTCCLLILTYILHELSYDRYHKKADNIYRVERTFINSETGAVNLALGSIAPPAGPLLQNDFEEIQKMTRIYSNGNTAFKYEDKRFNERNVYFADENIFHFFDFQLAKGSPQKALADPYSVLLTEDMARKYFGEADPLNKVVRIDNQYDAKVTGVYKAFPSNTHLHPQMLISFKTLYDTAVYGEERLRNAWSNNSFFTYIMMPDGYDIKKLQAQMPQFMNRHMGEGNPSFIPAKSNQIAFTKLTDIHLHSHKDLELEENGDVKRVYIFSAIALFILLIACINYMNLSTARSVLRAKEIGVRKTIGARRPELIAQFLSESVLISAMATTLAVLLTWMALPWLNSLSGQSLTIGSLLQWKVLIPLLLVPFIVGILSGIYPALFLSSFQPIKVLKGFLKIEGARFSLRKVLVVTQFSISIILIVSTIIVFKQLKYMQEKSLGFDREHVVTLSYNTELANNYEAFRTAMLSNAHIKDIARSTLVPSNRLLDASGSMIRRGDSLAPSGAEIKMVRVDDGFADTYAIRTVAGRSLSKEFGQRDTSSFIINEAAVKALGLSANEEAIGKDFQYGSRKGQIVGVWSDFHFESMHQRILPMAFFMPLTQRGYGNISVKISGANIPAALTHMENTWKAFLPQIPYEYTFLNESFGRLYEAETKQGSIFTLFAVIAIFIACLGLFGLSAFAISQRVKEIGIRKVLGANVNSIVALLSKDFLKLVVVAAVIAFPVAWWAMHQWLQDFAYRIDIPWWIFLLAGIIAAIVAFITISFQTVKAAAANPVKNLRTE